MEYSYGNYRIANIPTPDGFINNRDREYSMQAYESFQSQVQRIYYLCYYHLFYVALELLVVEIGTLIYVKLVDYYLQPVFVGCSLCHNAKDRKKY